MLPVFTAFYQIQGTGQSCLRIHPMYCNLTRVLPQRFCCPIRLPKRCSFSLVGSWDTSPRPKNPILWSRFGGYRCGQATHVILHSSWNERRGSKEPDICQLICVWPFPAMSVLILETRPSTPRVLSPLTEKVCKSTKNVCKALIVTSADFC